jgi:lipooligosaccharide transport system permease protein
MTALALHPSSLWHVVEHHIRRTRRAWAGLLISGVLNPVFTMLALGFGIGSQIEDTTSLGTPDYLHFVGPGVLAGSAFLQGGFTALWPTMSALRWEGAYQNVVRTPASAAEVLTGHLLWIALRLVFSSSLFLVVLLIGIGWSGPLALLVPFVAALTAVAVAAPICAFTASRETDKGFALVSRLIITPLFVFSGTFTSVDSFPSWMQGLVKAFPSFHGIELTRNLINVSGTPSTMLVNLAVLALWTFAGWYLAVLGFQKALTP